MTYQQTVLNSKPAGFWMITAPSGSSETDLSGNGKTATITEATDLIDRAYRPLVTGTTSDRAYRFWNTNHKLTYPSLEAWDANRDHIPFSIEMTIQPWVNTVETILFAPQESTSGYVHDNGLYIKEGLLRFAVSNGGGTAAGMDTKKSEVSYWTNYGQTYHVVAVYDVAKIYLYVDGVLVDSAPKDPAIKFTHVLANYVTTATKIPTDTAVSEVLVDAVSFYRRALTPFEINNHFVNSSPNVADLDLINSNNGKLIKLNDEDMTKALNFSARQRGWRDNNNTLVDLIVDDEGHLSLMDIDPPLIVTGPNNTGNLLTWNHASVEEDTTGFINLDHTPTYTRSTAQASHGSASMLVTTTATNVTSVGTSFATSPAVTPGKTYTAHVAFRQNVFTSGTYRPYIIWRTVNGVLISSVPGTIVTPSASWQRATVTATAPSNAAYAQVAALVSGHAAADSFYFDEMGLWEGTSTTWAPPQYNAFLPNTDLTDLPYNLLDHTIAYSDSGTTGWSQGTNCTRTHTTAQMHRGFGSIQSTSGASGDMQTFTSNVRVTPGERIWAGVYTKAATSTRTVECHIYWYSFTGSNIGTSVVGSATNSTTAWTKSIGSALAPAGAYSARLGAMVKATGAASEVHYIDSPWLSRTPATDFIEPRFGMIGISAISLHNSKCLLIKDAGRFLGVSSGGIGGFFQATTLENDHIAEQVLFTLSNSASTQYFEVVKKPDENLYIRYGYLDQTGAITVVEGAGAAASMNTTHYLYLEYSPSGVSLAGNTTPTPVSSITFDAGIPQPTFDFGSFVVIGAGVDKTRPWNNHVNWINLYPKAQPTEEWESNKLSTNGYTLKGINNLDVSQRGTATIVVPSGNDGVDTIESDAIYWEPNVPGVTITSTYGTSENLLKYTTSEGDVLAEFTAFQATLALNNAITDNSKQAIAATATTANVVNVQTDAGAANRFNVDPGKTYTAYVRTRAASVSTATVAVGFFWLNSAGSQLGNNTGTAVALSNSAYQTVTSSQVAPAGAVYAQVLVLFRGTFAISSVFYLDKFGAWEGSGTTWSPGYQAATYGGEIVGTEFPSIPPAVYSVKAVLTTDDSKYRVTKLRDLKLFNYKPNTIFSENSPDEIEAINRLRTFNDNVSMVRQGINNGIFVDSLNNRFYIKRVDDSQNASVPDGGTSGSTAGPSGNIRTLEFWVRPETQGYYFFHDGATEYSMRYYDSGGFTTTGFTTLYVDGVVQANASTLTTWYNRWHHIVLTNASNQINFNTDYTSAVNLLSANQASLESGATTGWAFSASTGAAINTISPAHGSYVLSVTATNTTGTYGRTPTGISGIPVTAGQTYTFSANARKNAANTGTNVLVRVAWYTSGGAGAGGTIDSSVTAVTSNGWTQVSVTGVAPATAAFATVHVMNASTWIVGDIFYWDEMGLWEGTSTDWVLPGATRNKNLLSVNQASVETDMTGLVQFGGAPTITRSTAEANHGAASMLLTVVSTTGSSAGSTPIPVTPGRTYTGHISIKQGTGTGFLTRVYLVWRDINGAQLTQNFTSSTAGPNWQNLSITAVAGPGAVSAQVLAYMQSNNVGDSIYVDRLGLWEGSDTNWTMPDAKAWLGNPAGSGTMARARYQNISYYPQSFAAGDVTAALAGYLGDVTGGAGTDNPGLRTVTDSANLLTVNQATTETDTSGWYQRDGSPTIVRSTADKYSGAASLLVTSTANGLAALGTAGMPSANLGHNTMPCIPGTSYTAQAKVKAVGTTRNISVYVMYYTSAGVFISANQSQLSVTSGAWVTVTHTQLAPSNAAYVALGLGIQASVIGDAFYFDEMGLWPGAGTVYAPPIMGGANPKAFTDVWDIQSVVVR